MHHPIIHAAQEELALVHLLLLHICISTKWGGPSKPKRRHCYAMPDIEARSITPITILFRIYLSLLSKCHDIFSSILFHCCLLGTPWYHLKIIDFVTSYFFISLYFFFSLLSLALCKVLKVSSFDKKNLTLPLMRLPH